MATAQPSVPDGVELSRATSPTRPPRAEPWSGVDRVVHLAAAVGVGQSMYEIERYVRDQHDGHRVASSRRS